MRPKIVVLLAGGSLLLGLAVGRYTLPAKVVHDVHIQRRYVTNTITKKVETKKPDGTDVIETEVDRTSRGATEADHHDETTYNTQKWDLVGLAGVDVPRNRQVYGGAVDYRLLGPITIGAWGLSSGAAGLSLGLRF